MQMSSVKILENSVLPLICVCLLAVLSWNLFLILSSVFGLLSIQPPTQHPEETPSDHPDARNVPRRRKDQFLAVDAARNECNYAGSVPIARPEPNSILKHLIEDIILDIGEFCLMNFISGFEHLRRNPDDHHVSVKMIENTECGMDSRPGENSSDVDERDEKFVGFVEDSLNGERTPVNEVTSSMMEVTLEEIRALSKFPDETEGGAGMKSDAAGEEDKTCRGNGSGVAGNQRAGIESQTLYTRSAHAASLEIATGGERLRSANSGGKPDEDGPETTATRYLAEKFLVSILEESLAFRTSSRKEHDAGRTIDEGRDGQRTPPKEGDYPVDEQFGVDPEKEANRAEGVSVMHSSKDATQSPAVQSEGLEEVGPAPETTSPLKNGRGTESTISLARPAATRAKEEEDLNAIIRRMIITELRKHRKKEQQVLKRAHSDTESVLPRKRHGENRTGLFNVKGRTFFHDLLELEESLRKGAPGNVSENESVETGLVEAIDEDEAGKKDDQQRSRNEVNTALLDRSCIISTTTVHKADSNIMLERKVNAACLRDAEESIGPAKASTVPETRVDKCTQTEHIYVIRSVRSCPLRRRRLPVQFQMHKIAAIRDAVYSKTVFANLDYTRFIFRIASDNLIYEKGKASRSPSYVPAPERYRWKYLTPTKVK